MKPYGQDEVAQIIQIRAQTEGIKIDNDAIQELSAIAEKASLRLVDHDECVALPHIQG